MMLTAEKQLEMLRSMQTIRRFEERASDDYLSGAISTASCIATSERKPSPWACAPP